MPASAKGAALAEIAGGTPADIGMADYVTPPGLVTSLVTHSPDGIKTLN